MILLISKAWRKVAAGLLAFMHWNRTAALHVGAGAFRREVGIGSPLSGTPKLKSWRVRSFF